MFRVVVLHHETRKYFAQEALVAGVVEIDAENLRLRGPHAVGVELRWIDYRRIEMTVFVCGLDAAGGHGWPWASIDTMLSESRRVSEVMVLALRPPRIRI